MSLSTIAVLPLDQASIVYEDPVFDEVVLKHVDGEYVRVRQTGDIFSLGRIHEGAITWHEVTVSTFDRALFRATDMQALGFRVGGRAETLVTRGTTGEDGSVIELEPLDLGGVIVDDYSHLPPTIRYIDNTLWRVRIESTSGESEVVVENKPPSEVQWRSVDREQGIFQPAHAVEHLLEVGPGIVSVDAPVNGYLQKALQ